MFRSHGLALLVRLRAAAQHHAARRYATSLRAQHGCAVVDYALINLD
jgi:hypothetical protein